ncbi:MAG: nitroreductase/quinone reductase family protein [Solirubrobacteraceae bacterium]
MAATPTLIRVGSRMHARVVRWSRGRIGGRYVGAPVLVLATVGRHSGRRREVPVYYLRVGESFVLTAANLGAARSPRWFENLMAAGRGEVILGRNTIAVRPRLAEGEERERLWAELRAMYRGYDTYQARTERELAVVILTPQD